MWASLCKVRYCYPCNTDRLSGAQSTQETCWRWRRRQRAELEHLPPAPEMPGPFQAAELCFRWMVVAEGRATLIAFCKPGMCGENQAEFQENVTWKKLCLLYLYEISTPSSAWQEKPPCKHLPSVQSPLFSNLFAPAMPLSAFSIYLFCKLDPALTLAEMWAVCARDWAIDNQQRLTFL